MTGLSCYFALAALFASSSNTAVKAPDMKELAQIAVRHGVPMPSKDARLVLAHTESWSVLGNKSTSRDPGIYSPAFLLEERADDSIVILRGIERVVLERRSPREPLWRPFSLEPVVPRLGGHVTAFDRLSAFVCAVQLAARGDTANAQGIWKRFAEAGWWAEAQLGEDVRGQLQDPALLLARCIFDHLRDRLRQGPANWRDVHTRMKALFDDFPRLKTPGRRDLFDGLTATVRAAPPAAGSTEALLLDWARRPSDMRHLGWFQDGVDGEPDAPARVIIFRGFDAVPDLIALLPDRRITAHEGIGRVGGLAEGLLQKITGMESGSAQTPGDAAAWRAWWGRVRGQRERDFFVAVVFCRKGQQITGVNEGPARILAYKFPDALPPLCAAFSREACDDAQPFALAEAVAASRLPKEVRVKELSEFAQRGSLERKRCVLLALAPLEPQRCAEIVGPLLKQLPKDATGPYWTCPEAGFTHVVQRLEDDGVWREYLRAARRGTVGMRLEMMGPMTYDYIGDKNRERRLAFLAAFLGDTAVRDMAAAPDKFQGPCAAMTFPRIAVRDFAALQIAQILGLEDAPDEFWDADQWGRLRDKVRGKLAGEKLPMLE
jgi:hypothetical protein